MPTNRVIDNRIRNIDDVEYVGAHLDWHEFSSRTGYILACGFLVPEVVSGGLRGPVPGVTRWGCEVVAEMN
jgi:hypothetical protein